MASASFLNLAYLIEISVVLNVAYREFKFQDLHEKLNVDVSKIVARAEEQELHLKPEMYPEYGELKSLLDKDASGTDGLWAHNQSWGRFFYKNIRGRRSYRRVNANVLICIIILIFSTLFSYVQVPPFIEHPGSDILPILWLTIFLVLVATIVMPIRYIHLATKCQSFLFSYPNGQVPKLEQKMFARAESEISKDNATARKFKVPTEL